MKASIIALLLTFSSALKLKTTKWADGTVIREEDTPPETET